MKSDRQKNYLQHEINEGNRKKKIIVENFDPVKMMRDIRQELSREIMGIDLEQEKAYLGKLPAKG